MYVIYLSKIGLALVMPLHKKGRLSYVLLAFIRSQTCIAKKTELVEYIYRADILIRLFAKLQVSSRLELF